MSEQMNTLNIVIVGVGGQGTLLASRVLGHIAQQKGYDVKVSEVHGMSQRGGSVITYVRMGQKVFSPLVEQGGADYLLAFEELEALRALPLLKTDGVLIMNTQKINPLPVTLKLMEYPPDIVGYLQNQCDLVAMDALPLAKAAGNERAVNTVLLGALSARLPFEESLWTKALEACVKPQFLESNLAAFAAGRTPKPV